MGNRNSFFYSQQKVFIWRDTETPRGHHRSLQFKSELKGKHTKGISQCDYDTIHASTAKPGLRYHRVQKENALSFLNLDTVLNKNQIKPESELRPKWRPTSKFSNRNSNTLSQIRVTLNFQNGR